ncbi:MAG: hypothetical protein ABI780_07590 [Ardenticatenales bacterium]
MSDPQRSEAANALIEAARRRAAAAPRMTDAPPSSDATATADASRAPSRRGWRTAAQYIGRWIAIGLALTLAWQLVRPPRTFDSFALRLLTSAAALMILTLLRDPSSMAIVSVSRIFAVPGSQTAQAQREAFMTEIDRAQHEPPWTIYRFVAVVTLIAIALILLAVT